MDDNPEIVTKSEDRQKNLEETPERKTGPARCRGIDAYGYPENGV